LTIEIKGGEESEEHFKKLLVHYENSFSGGFYSPRSGDKYGYKRGSYFWFLFFASGTILNKTPVVIF